EDFAAGLRYQLPVENPVDVDGRFFQKIPLVGGLTVWQANDVVIEALKEHQRLLRIESYQHSYPHCWRHKSPLIFRATRQWFIGMEAGTKRTLREIAKAAVDATAFFAHNETGELHPRTEEWLEQVAQRVEKEGIEAWFALEAAELLGGDAGSYRKVSDTLDVWFDSGTTHVSVLERRAELTKPADL